MTPPTWVRRVVLLPAVPALALLAVTSLPLTALVAAAVSPLIPGRWRPLRLLLFVLVWLGTEALTIGALLAIRVARLLPPRLGRRERRSKSWSEYRVMRWYLAILVHVAARAFRLHVEVDAPESTIGRPSPDKRGPVSERRPLVVLCRHAGPGDSFLLVHLLLQSGWRPRIVLKESLRWLPSLDVAFTALPTHFVGRASAPGAGTEAVARLASTMGQRDALVVFPEGRNFTPGRRQHSIDRLEELGRHAEAEAARQMRHVLSPRAGGAMAAVRASPDADVLFVAHAGLEDLSGLVDLWRGLPMDASVRVDAWKVDASDVPRSDDAEFVQWLHGWWRHIDRWLVDHHGTEVVPESVVEALRRGTPPSPDEVDDAPR